LHKTCGNDNHLMALSDNASRRFCCVLVCFVGLVAEIVNPVGPLDKTCGNRNHLTALPDDASRRYSFRGFALEIVTNGSGQPLGENFVL